MAGSNIGNPVGYVPIFDGGVPRIIGGTAKEGISGGVFVFASGTDNVVSSGTNSYVLSDIQFTRNASGLQFNGINTATVASGATMAVATRGSFLLVANGTVTAGFPVRCDSNNSVANVSSTGTANHQTLGIGRALTSAASGGYCIVDINA